MGVPLSRATSANEARMAGRELISVMSRSNPTGPDPPIPPPSPGLLPMNSTIVHGASRRPGPLAACAPAALLCGYEVGKPARLLPGQAGRLAGRAVGGRRGGQGRRQDLRVLRV